MAANIAINVMIIVPEGMIGKDNILIKFNIENLGMLHVMPITSQAYTHACHSSLLCCTLSPELVGVGVTVV
jgi:hypothetical protein